MTVIAPDGTQFGFGTVTGSGNAGVSVTDPNGNRISNVLTSYPQTIETDWTDALGQIALKVIYLSNNGLPEHDYARLAVDGSYQTIAVKYQTFNVKTNFSCTGVGEINSSTYLVSEIDLPNNTKYLFTYEPTPGSPGFVTGRLQEVNLPAGGSVTYQYPGANGGVNCADGTVLNLTRTLNDGTTQTTWSYSRSGNTTTVTAPQLPYDSAGNQSALTFDSNGHEISRKIYQGSATGNPINTVNTTWAANNTPANQIRILEDGSTQNEVETVYDSNGILQSATEHDWGKGAPGPVLRTRNLTYLSTSAYTNLNMIDKVTQEMVADGSAAIKSRTDIGYDDPSFTNSKCVSGAAQHDDTNYGCSYTTRGLATSVTTYTDAATPAGGVTKNFSYDSVGNLIGAQLNCCQQKQWNFSATTQYAFSDSVVSGTSGGPQLTTSATYNLTTGELASATDENGQVTTFTYADPGHMDRLTDTKRPDDAHVTYSYDDTQHTITSSSPLQGTSVVQKIAAYDGLGRAIANTIEDTNSNIYSVVQTQYDALGRPYKSSNPYTGSPQFWTTAQFDALGRPTVTTLPDGALASVSYSTNAVTSTDPAGKQKRSISDGLGRVIEVDEPNGTSGGANATASVTISGAAQSVIGAGAAPGLPATRIQTSGGSSRIKYFFSAGGPSQNGVGYIFSVTVRNQGSAAVKLAGNFVDGPVVQPGTTQSVCFTGMGDGVDIAQLLFETLNVGDSMDVVALAPSIVKVSDGINLIPAGSQNFAAGWTAWSGASVAITQGQIIPATRIQASGGSSNIKYFFSTSGASQNGAGYLFSVALRNQGSAPVKLAGNFVDGPVIQPGTTQSISFTGMGDGVDIAQLLLETLNVGDSMDVVALAPSIAKVSDGLNLIPASSQTFSTGWTAWSGAAVTVTQSQIVPATRIQSSGGSSNIKYFFSAGGASQNGVPYSFSVTLRNQGPTAVKLAGNFVDGPVIQPGIMQSVTFIGNGDGVDIPQLLFETLNPGDAMDVIAFAPAIAKVSDGINLIPSASQHFVSGWSAWSGAAVTLTQGRTDLGISDTIYDTGIVALTIDSFTATACYGSSVNSACAGQAINSTATQVAAALVQALNSAASPVTATASGSTINMTWREIGITTTAVPALASTPDHSTIFPSGSYSSQSTNFSGGQDSLTNPNSTFYTYNTLGNLLNVTQGQQTRSYVYDSMGRLTTATTPEAGQVSYQYNAFDLITQKTDARGVKTNIGYDGLNRVQNITYDVGTTGVTATPGVGYTYGTDSSSNNNGRLLKATDGLGSETYTYDLLGRMTQLQKVINSTTYTIGYAYNLAGEVTSITYPSGRVVQQSFDPIGRLCEIAPQTTGCGTATSPYASGFGYNAASQITGFNYGNGVAATFGYSSDRLQLTTLGYAKGTQLLFGLNYFYKQDSTNCPSGPAGNNGQIDCITDNVDAGRNLAYSYDTLGRLISAATKGSSNFPLWGLSFTYDRYGNRTAQTVTAGSGLSSSTPVDPTTNRISIAPYSYDANGNMLNDGMNALAYDAANRLVSSTQAGVISSYSYDCRNLRAVKVSGGVTTVYIFSGNRVIAEYGNGAAVSSPAREYIYSGTALLAKIEGGGATYYHADHLSARLTTDSGGNISGQQGHYPFGEPWYDTVPANKWKFTTYERDSESGNDYALARFDINRLGRFSSPDPLSGSTGDPQTLNRYSYVANDPINLSDPTGQFITGFTRFLDPAGFGSNPSFGSNMSEFDLMNIPILRYVGTYYVISDGYEGLANAVAAVGNGLDIFGNGFDQIGLNNAINALKIFAKMNLSDQCKDFLNKVGAQAGRPFTAESLQQQAKASMSTVYDGASSPTTMQSISFKASGTVGQFFAGKPDAVALSQVTGNAVWVRSAAFGSTTGLQGVGTYLPAYLGTDGQPTRDAIATMAHEMIHKFDIDDAGLESAMAVKDFAPQLGSQVISMTIASKCL